MALINRAFVLSVELILLSVHCYCILLIDFGIESEKAGSRGEAETEKCSRQWDGESVRNRNKRLR